MAANGTGLSAVRQLKETKDDSGQSVMEPVELLAHALLGRCMTATGIVEEADCDGSGEVDVREFVGLCRNKLHLPLTEEQLLDVFQKCDADKSGLCSAAEVQKLITDAIKKMEQRLLSSAKPPSEEIKDERADTKFVALVAHNHMKPSMMTFVAEHRNFFKTVQIVTTGSTGAALEKRLGLEVAHKVASGPLGGDQEIGGMISRDEVAAVFFFIDPLFSHPHEADIRAFTRICQVHNVACAETPITGAALVHAFQTSEPHKQLLHKGSPCKPSDAVEKYIADQKAVITKVVAGA